MKPRLSRSNATSFVSFEYGEPATTTTSILAPFLARFALRWYFSSHRFLLLTVKIDMLTKARIVALNTRFFEIHLLEIVGNGEGLSIVDLNEGAEEGDRFNKSGSHEAV